MYEIAACVEIISINSDLEAVPRSILILVGDIRQGCIRDPIAEIPCELDPMLFSVGDIKDSVTEGAWADNLQRHPNP